MQSSLSTIDFFQFVMKWILNILFFYNIILLLGDNIIISDNQWICIIMKLYFNEIRELDQIIPYIIIILSS